MFSFHFNRYEDVAQKDKKQPDIFHDIKYLLCSLINNFIIGKNIFVLIDVSYR